MHAKEALSYSVACLYHLKPQGGVECWFFAARNCVFQIKIVKENT
jgi:hypothetical protein